MTRPLSRCAIYTRVSSDQGLEQDFNSLQAQREAAEAFIKSQAHEGWRLHRRHYDDGGFSGGSMERPALKELLADLRNGHIDVIVVYKVDRLSRSLADFAKLVEIFDAHKASFVSVTQSFNTTSSMGRLTLNVLLSFAQFEREVTGERIRDKIAASKRKGIWMGGVVPLGYRVEDRKLVVDPVEAKSVRLIFDRYIAVGSLPALQRELRERGIRTRERILANGKTIGGVALTNGPLSHLLRNRMYLGELNHKGISYASDHEPIIDRVVFDAVQDRLLANLNQVALRRSSSNALLRGRIVDQYDRPMSPSHTSKRGVRYRYYVSAMLVQGRRLEDGVARRIPAQEVETIVIDGLRQYLPQEILASYPDKFALVQHVALRVVVGAGALELTWTEPSPLEDEELSRSARILYVPQPYRRRRDIVEPTDAAGYIKPIERAEQQRLIKSIALAKEWLREIMTGAPIASIAERERKSERMIRLALSLAFLDPKLVKAVLLGTLPRGVSTRRLLQAPSDWSEQWRAIGLVRPV